MGGTKEQIKSLVDAGGVAGLVGVLAITETDTSEIFTISLTTLHNILKVRGFWCLYLVNIVETVTKYIKDPHSNAVCMVCSLNINS